ncbi:MAG: ABC transporter permease, partial [Candidatus Gallimonas sp.]
MKKKIALSVIKWAFVGIVLLLLYAPILLLAVYSFVETDMIGTWGEISLVHYAKLFGDPVILEMIGNTLLLAFLAALLSTVLGTAGALGMYYSKKRTRTLMQGANQIPVINAEIVTALALAITFVVVGL